MADLRSRAAALRADIVAFVQELVRTPSLSGEEGAVAGLLERRMHALGYDEVRVDEVGNVVGVIRGRGHGRTVLFNGHMDHVPPTNMTEPYSGALTDGKRFGRPGEAILGRATTDMKGPVACMIMQAALLRELQVTGDVYVTAVVLEEPGGQIGARALLERNHLAPNVAVVGECTNLRLALGHRGVVWLKVTTRGVSCHASAPERGVNALLQAIPVIEALHGLNADLPRHPVLGASTLAVTTIAVRPAVENVIPYECTVGIDVRNTPNFSLAELEQRLLATLGRSKVAHPQLRVSFSYDTREWRTYTGQVERAQSIHTPFYTEPSHPFVQQAVEALTPVLGHRPELTTWQFATDGCAFADRGIPTIGFGPGEERFTHSADEHVYVDDLVSATAGYAALSLALTRSD